MILTLKNISKSYGKKTALNKVSIDFENGIYGLLGPNGAGKTTLISVIVGLLEAKEGEILCDDVSKKKLKNQYYDYIGCMPQYPGYYGNFTGYEMLDYYGVLKGIKKSDRKKRILELLKLVNLAEQADKKVSSYSGGMKQRLGIGCALLNNPKILILDEPTAGLDPEERIRFRNLLSKISDDKIVIIATHIVSDVELIANKIILLGNGEIIRNGSVGKLCEEIQDIVWQLETEDKAVADCCLEKYVVSNIYKEGSRYSLRIISEKQPSEKAVRICPKLEDVYLHYFSDKEADNVSIRNS